MRRTRFVLCLVAACTTVLFYSFAGMALAGEQQNQQEQQPWQVWTIPIPISGVLPSFISAADNYIAWTGATTGGYSSMYIFDLVTGISTLVHGDPPGNYYNPSADGPWVVYQGGRAAAYDDIYLYNTTTGASRQITHNSDPGDAHDWNPRIDAGRIVWEKHTSSAAAKPGIYLYDIRSGTSTCIIEGDRYRDPDISGNHVVSTRSVDSDGASELVLYDLSTQELITIAQATRGNEDPRIDSGQVVWSSHETYTPSAHELWSTYQIQLYNIAVGSTVPLTNNVAGNLKPCIEGTLAAWKTREPSAIMVRDTVGETVPQRLPAQGDEVQAPDIVNGSIVWGGAKGLYYAMRAAEAPRFPDVLPQYQYAAAIESLAEKEVIAGYKDGRFGFNDWVTRQQFAKMIVLAMALHYPEEFTPTLGDTYEFKDSASIERREGELYPYHYVAKAALTGLVRGYSDGTFRPFEQITRQQVITMIVRAGSQALQSPPLSWRGELDYSDPEHGERIRLAEYNGLLSGIVGPKGTLKSWDTTAKATRGEVAQMLHMLLSRLSATD